MKGAKAKPSAKLAKAKLKPKAMEMGAFAYVAKPVGLGQLHQTVAAALGGPDPLAPPRV